LTVCYGIIEAAGLGAELGQVGHGDGIPPHYEFFPVGAVPQDRQGSFEFPAAHLAPCTLEVADPKNAKDRPELYRIFSDGISRSFIEGLFKKTELVHRLTNYADSLCEGTKRPEKTGMSHVLAQSCKLMVQDSRLSPKEIFYEKLVPEFQQEARRQLDDYQSKLSRRFPDPAPRTGLLDRFGRPFDWDPERADTRVSAKASPETRRLNQEAVVQILNIYATTRAPQLSEVNTMAGQFQALRANERREALDRERTRRRAPGNRFP
jgi:hypothetical protein